MPTARLTKHQKETLLRLCRAANLTYTPRPGRWILDKDCGGPAALEHLYFKGYAEREIRIGPRGGERCYYRPSETGWAVRDRHFIKVAEADGAAEREMPLHEIDTRLIEARKSGAVVRVFAGPTGEFRGVPGPVERDDNGSLRLVLGQRKILLGAIRKVTA